MAKKTDFFEIRPEESENLVSQFELSLSRAVLRHDTLNLSALQMLGHSLTRLGRHKEALEVDKRIACLAPDDDVAHYNLACSYSNLGRLDEALAALARSVELGYDNVEYMMHDPDLENVRRDPRYQDIVDSISAGKSGKPRG
jgi:tetratricopeptide (TPR) repeat protein